MTEDSVINNIEDLRIVEEENIDEYHQNNTEIDIHHLQNKWTFYFFKNDRSKDWIDNMKKVIDFSTVEDFWGLMNHIAPPSKLPSGCDYYVFKENIQPMWEDDRNKNGGMWLLTFDKNQRNSFLDPCWLEILMLLVGETFEDDSDEICGAVVNIRAKGDRVSVWTTDCKSEEAIKRIGQRIKEALGLSTCIEYTSHTDMQNKSSSKAKYMFKI